MLQNKGMRPLYFILGPLYFRIYINIFEYKSEIIIRGLTPLFPLFYFLMVLTLYGSFKKNVLTPDSFEYNFTPTPVISFINPDPSYFPS
jgi:hypothetical protein